MEAEQLDSIVIVGWLKLASSGSGFASFTDDGECISMIPCSICYSFPSSLESYRFSGRL